MDTRREDLQPGMKVLLKYHGQDLGVLDIESKWKPDKTKEAKMCYGTSSLEHPGVHMIATERGQYYIGGSIHGLGMPKRVFPCKTPAQIRQELPSNVDVVAFQCRNPVHRAHYELFTRALHAENVGEGAVCLVHPTCGPTQDDDIPGIVRYHTYEVLKEEVNNPYIHWAYLPYSMHMAGPREAIQHMIIRKITDTVPSLNVVYTKEKGYVTADVAEKENLHCLKLSGTKFRKMLRSGEEIPEWFAFKSVVKVLRDDMSRRAKAATVGDAVAA
eukprot:jgi/Pico_ML_1/50866/g1999.t1